jgi:hypothetical protein
MQDYVKKKLNKHIKDFKKGLYAVLQDYRALGEGGKGAGGGSQE